MTNLRGRIANKRRISGADLAAYQTDRGAAVGITPCGQRRAVRRNMRCSCSLRNTFAILAKSRVYPTIWLRCYRFRYGDYDSQVRGSCARGTLPQCGMAMRPSSGAQPNGMPKLRSLETGPAYRFAKWAIESVPKVAAGVAARPGPPPCFNSCERRHA